MVSVPDYTTLYRFLRRLHETDLAHALPEVVHRVPWRRRRRATIAVDATGLAQGAVSTFFVRRMYHHTQQPLPLATLVEMAGGGRRGEATHLGIPDLVTPLLVRVQPDEPNPLAGLTDPAIQSQ
jgi:hypothetical protein